ncbi:MAG: RyR domain-containing protein [Candidatus Micrarchaeia archaeon]
MSEEFVLDPETLEKLAEAVHQVWMEGKLRDGWRQGDIIDKEKKIHTCLVPYNQLSEVDKESDRDIARAIQKILDIAGYKIVKKV